MGDRKFLREFNKIINNKYKRTNISDQRKTERKTYSNRKKLKRENQIHRMLKYGISVNSKYTEMGKHDQLSKDYKSGTKSINQC
jgi:type I site-specific restriction-modification system R (restriction) subunit